MLVLGGVVLLRLINVVVHGYTVFSQSLLGLQYSQHNVPVRASMEVVDYVN